MSGPLVGALGLLLALGALVLWWLSRRGRRELGLPAGRIVRADMGGWQECERPLYSARYRLAGKPDYLVKSGRSLTPVEVKPGRNASSPYPGDVLQLGAYLLLIEETTGVRPERGLLRYRTETFEIPNTAALRASVIETLEEMDELRAEDDVLPQHDEPRRCQRCGHREHCERRLA